MEINTTTTLITGLVTSYGGAALTIITATVGLGVAYLAFRFGWASLKASLNGGVSHRKDGTFLPNGFKRKGNDFYKDGEKLPF